MQKFADEPITIHEKCGGKVERLISAPSLQFKGSGFYINDYGKGGATKPADNGSSQKSDSTPAKPSGSSESGSSTTSAPASSSSTESKPASSSSKSSSSESK